MYTPTQQYQQQAVLTASPGELIAKLYDLGISACHRGDRSKVRAVLVELLSSLDLERGGAVARPLQAVYEFCLSESAAGDLDLVRGLLGELRDAWRQSVLQRQPA